MSNIDKQALREAAEKALPAMKRLLMMPNDELFDEALLNVDGDVDAANAFNLLTGPETVMALLDELEAAERRIAELEAREVKPVAWMRNANATSFMSRFTTNENYAVEQWGDDAVALYSLPVDYIPACFTDERNLMHINERGRETSLIWSEQNSDSDDIQLFRIAAAAGKGE